MVAIATGVWGHRTIANGVALARRLFTGHAQPPLTTLRRWVSSTSSGTPGATELVEIGRLGPVHDFDEPYVHSIPFIHTHTHTCTCVYDPPSTRMPVDMALHEIKY